MSKFWEYFGFGSKPDRKPASQGIEALRAEAPKKLSLDALKDLSKAQGLFDIEAGAKHVAAIKKHYPQTFKDLEIAMDRAQTTFEGKADERSKKIRAQHTKVVDEIFPVLAALFLESKADVAKSKDMDFMSATLFIGAMIECSMMLLWHNEFSVGMKNAPKITKISGDEIPKELGGEDLGRAIVLSLMAKAVMEPLQEMMVGITNLLIKEELSRKS